MEFEIITQQMIQQFFNGFYWFFSAITELGGENAILFFIVAIYFGFDKKLGEKIGFICLGSGCINGALKLSIARVRPFVQNPSMAKLNLQTLYADSFSMPSGHSQNATTLFFSIFKGFASRLVKGFAIATVILVPLSRVVLGVHYISDVLVGVAIGIALVFLGWLLYEKCGKHIQKVYLYTSIGVTATTLIFLIPLSLGQKIDTDIIKTFGAFGGFCMGCYLENRFVHLDIRVSPIMRVARIVFVIAALLLIRIALKSVFAFFGDFFLLDFARYFILTLVALYVCPLLFKRFTK